MRGRQLGQPGKPYACQHPYMRLIRRIQQPGLPLTLNSNLQVIRRTQQPGLSLSLNPNPQVIRCTQQPGLPRPVPRQQPLLGEAIVRLRVTDHLVQVWT